MPKPVNRGQIPKQNPPQVRKVKPGAEIRTPKAEKPNVRVPKKLDKDLSTPANSVKIRSPKQVPTEQKGQDALIKPSKEQSPLKNQAKNKKSYNSPKQKNTLKNKAQKAKLKKEKADNTKDQKPEKIEIAKELKLFWEKFKANKSLHKILSLALILILLVLFSLLPAFRLLSFESNELYLHNAESLLEASGLRKNQHFLKSIGGSLAAFLQTRYAGAEDKVKAVYPELKDIKLSYRFPGTLQMEVEERIPLAFLDMGELYITLDRFAIACGSYEELPEQLPYISGIDVMNMKIGEPIVSNADDALKHCVSVMSALFEADVENPSSRLLLPMAKEIRSSGYQRIILTLDLATEDSVEENQDLRVSVGHSDDLKKDFLSLKKVLESNALDGKLPGTLDIYGSRLVFRPENSNKDSAEEYVWQADVAAAQEITQDIPVEVPLEDVQEQ